jgi:transcription elongation GreA/GreB family factor
MAEIIDPRKLNITDRVVFGATVTIEDVDSGERKVISIYGAEESDVEKGWISFEAPLGKGLIGKELGDVVKVPLPGGAREYEIIELALTYEETEEIVIEGDEA